MNAEPSTFILYGIANCDSIKKARRWLEAHQYGYRFHDYRTDGVDAATLRQAIRQLGWQPLLNTRSTTWRQLSDAQRATVREAEGALALMLAHPTVIKRPLLQQHDRWLVGFNAEQYRDFCREVTA